MIKIRTATIASGQQLSSAVDTEGMTVIAVRIPAAITGTTLTVKESISTTGTFGAYKPNGTEFTATIAANDCVQFNPPIATEGAVKFDTGSNEAADRTLTVVLRDIS